jgi:hypothetical protein
MREKCQALEQEFEISIDERMQKYKGRCAGNMRQYMPAKPSAKWGFKIYVMAGKSGMTYDFIVYSGKDTFATEALTNDEKAMGVGAMAVIALCKSVKNPEQTTVTFDNYYTGLPLLTYLQRRMHIVRISLSSSRHLSTPVPPYSTFPPLVATIVPAPNTAPWLPRSPRQFPLYS